MTSRIFINGFGFQASRRIKGSPCHQSSLIIPTKRCTRTSTHTVIAMVHLHSVAVIVIVACADIFPTIIGSRSCSFSRRRFLVSPLNPFPIRAGGCEGAASMDQWFALLDQIWALGVEFGLIDYGLQRVIGSVPCGLWWDCWLQPINPMQSQLPILPC